MLNKVQNFKFISAKQSTKLLFRKVLDKIKLENEAKQNLLLLVVYCCLVIKLQTIQL